MRVLVTGGAGFLGRYIVAELLAAGHQVVSFQRSAAPELAQTAVLLWQTSGEAGAPALALPEAQEQLTVIRGSLTDAAQVNAACQGCDAAVHVAALAGVWGRRADFEAVNVQGTRHVLEACRAQGVRYLVHTSTPSVVFTGEAFAGADERLPYGRNWLCDYARTKAQAEAEALAAQGEGFAVCALRPHLIWGVGDPHLLPRVVARARSGRLRIVGDGTNRVDITDVRNAARAHLQALEALQAGRAGGRAYFLSQGDPVALWPWLNALLARLDLPQAERRVPLKTASRLGAVCEGLWRALRLPGEPPMTRFVATELAKDHWFDITAARRDLGYVPETFPTAAGVEAWLKAQR